MLIRESLTDVAVFLAQSTTQAATQPSKPGWAELIQNLGMFPLLLVMIVLVFWMSSRTRRRQEREKQDMLGAMKRGDRVQTIGGILGNIVEVHENWVLVKVDESNNTKVKFARSAIHRVLGDEAEAK